MRNAALMSMARRPVTCTTCGYTTTPVSGFCPRCLERLPLGRRGIGVLPLFAGGALAVLVLGAVLAATLRSPEPGRGSVQAEGSHAPVSSASAAPASQSPSSNGSPRPSAQAPSATAPAPAIGVPAPSPSSGAASPAAVLPSTATIGDIHIDRWSATCCLPSEEQANEPPHLKQCCPDQCAGLHIYQQ